MTLTHCMTAASENAVTLPGANGYLQHLRKLTAKSTNRDLRDAGTTLSKESCSMRRTICMPFICHIYSVHAVDLIAWAESGGSLESRMILMPMIHAHSHSGIRYSQPQHAGLYVQLVPQLDWVNAAAKGLVFLCEDGLANHLVSDQASVRGVVLLDDGRPELRRPGAVSSVNSVSAVS